MVFAALVDAVLVIKQGGIKMGMKENAFAFIDAHRSEMLKMWEELVSIDSGSDYKPGVDKVVAKVADVLTAMGGKTRIVEHESAGNAVVSEFGDCANKPFIVLTGHLDTVFSNPEETKARPFTIKDGRAYGPGALDMKGGVTLATFGLQALLAEGFDKYAFKVVLAGDEETGHKSSDLAETMMAEFKGATAAFDFETGFMNDNVVVERKGFYRFSLETYGRSVHAGNEPQNGRNAIVELAHKAVGLDALTDWETGTTINVGTIEGGTVANAVPGYAKMVVDVRYLDPADFEKKKAQFKEVADKVYIKDVTTKMTSLAGLEPMVRLDGSMKLFDVYKSVYEENGFGNPEPIMVGGGSDATYTTKVGVPTVCAMGVKGGRNHTVEEFADVESLFMRAKLICAVMLAL